MKKTSDRKTANSVSSPVQCIADTIRKSRLVLASSWASVLVCFLSASCVQMVSAQDYSVEGRLEITARTFESDSGETSTFEFKADVSSNGYNIRVWREGDNSNYHEYAYADGTMHILHHLSRVVDSSGAVRVVSSRDLTPYVGSSETRDIPPTDGSRAQFIWFAYASSQYLSSLPTNSMPPIWSPEDPTIRKQPFEIPVFWERSPRPPHLPWSAQFVSDGYYRSYNPSTKKLDVIPLASPYDRGFTNALYRVLETTNLNSIVLPTRFVFEIYSSPIFKTAVPFNRLVVKGNTTRVLMSGNSKTAPPQFKGVAQVTDYRQPRAESQNVRMDRSPYITYSITNGTWLDVEGMTKARVRSLNQSHHVSR
jgi:hypothetical protein